jgi:hypothetical protein
MEGTPAIYLGRLVSKNNFRAFIYGADGTQRLVESWKEFEAHMQTGLWFATAEEVKPKSIPKSRAVKAKEIKVLIDDEPLRDEEGEMVAKDAAFEVKDDFLPKG